MEKNYDEVLNHLGILEKERDCYRDIYDQQRTLIDKLTLIIQQACLPMIVVDGDTARRCRPGEVIQIPKGKKK